MAYNIPYCFWSPDGKRENAYFVKDIMKRLEQAEKLLIICCSGQRSSKVCEELVKNGFKEVFNIDKGFEGDKAEDINSIYYGYRRHLNGWQHDGLPYTYELKEGLAYKLNE
jgi:rhodanese-related sulfurtransferase